MANYNHRKRKAQETAYCIKNQRNMIRSGIAQSAILCVKY